MDSAARSSLTAQLERLPDQAEQLLEFSEIVADPNLSFALRVAADEMLQLWIKLEGVLKRHPTHIPSCAIQPLLLFAKDLQGEVCKLMERVEPLLQSRNHLERCWRRIY